MLCMYTHARTHIYCIYTHIYTKFELPKDMPSPTLFQEFSSDLLTVTLSRPM